MRKLSLFRGDPALDRHLVARLFRLVVGHLRRETGGADIQAGGVFQAPDDVGRELAGAVALFTVLEDIDQNRRDLERNTARSAISWNREMSFTTKSMVKLISREPFRITWLSVSWTKELPEEMRIAS